ncbi:hypothetical protein BLNAU_10350 [Blattamonas nauphoetae]|uniref:Uncharacterized protein n=1 Tax=Blattamonas nauphoetae TaxID=2049346 RepID=A0ABQ9XT92_9EUKA|nr:hypothetical protein BLNAU_10350 [Blattamonas nauphoetae]
MNRLKQESEEKRKEQSLASSEISVSDQTKLTKSSSTSHVDEEPAPLSPSSINPNQTTKSEQKSHSSAYTQPFSLPITSVFAQDVDKSKQSQQTHSPPKHKTPRRPAQPNTKTRYVELVREDKERELSARREAEERKEKIERETQKLNQILVSQRLQMANKQRNAEQQRQLNELNRQIEQLEQEITKAKRRIHSEQRKTMDFTSHSHLSSLWRQLEEEREMIDLNADTKARVRSEIEQVRNEIEREVSEKNEVECDLREMRARIEELKYMNQRDTKQFQQLSSYLQKFNWG